MITINDSKITHENLEKEIFEELRIQPKQIIYISKHKSKTGKPTLSVHPIGNYGKAEYGGKSKKLVKTSPRLMTYLLRLLKNNAVEKKLYHDVCFEVTHHGPYLETPTLFIEVGSNKKEWQKKEPAKIVAKSILDLLKKYNYENELPKNIPVLIGIGEGHYAPRFTDIVFKKKAAFGHMIPSYHIKAGNINESTLNQAIEKTPNLYAVYIHKKSVKKTLLSEYKKFFQKQDIPVISSKELTDL